MILRIELEDFEGVREYAKYDHFYVANEYLRYRLSVSGYRYSNCPCMCMYMKYNEAEERARPDDGGSLEKLRKISLLLYVIEWK